MEVHKKVWGEEHWIVNNKKYCGKLLFLKKDFRCSLHHHEIKTETFYILSGKVKMELECKAQSIFSSSHILTAGNTLHVCPGILHRFTGLEDSEIIEFSTQHFEDDSYRDPENLSGPVPESQATQVEEAAERIIQMGKEAILEGTDQLRKIARNIGLPDPEEKSLGTCLVCNKPISSSDYYYANGSPLSHSTCFRKWKRLFDAFREEEEDEKQKD